MIGLGAIGKGLAWAWTWVSPWAGPWLLRVAPWLSLVPGVASLKRWAMIGVWFAILGAGAWGGVRLNAWWSGGKLTQQEANDRTRAVVDGIALAAERAALDAERKALAEQRAALEGRARWAEQMQIMQDQFERDMEADRARNEGDAAIAVSGDDVWLRAWQRRKY